MEEKAWEAVSGKSNREEVTSPCSVAAYSYILYSAVKNRANSNKKWTLSYIILLTSNESWYGKHQNLKSHL